MKYELVRKGLVLGIIILFVGAGVIPSMSGVVVDEKSNHPISNGNTLYVGGSLGGNYSSIQDAINDAVEGDTVFVYDDSSPYYENVNINKRINLVGEDRNTTVIDGGENGNVVFSSLPTYNVYISGFTIQNSGTDRAYAGISFYSGSNTITGNIISNNEKGISSNYDSNNITGNIITENNKSGISLSYSDSNTIISNIISKNKDGIYLLGCSKNIIMGNTISKNRCGIYLEDSVGDFQTPSRENNIVKNNFLFNILHATFFYFPYESLFLKNRWSQNYWDRPRILPKPIFGLMVWIPWFNFDWRPALKPYEI